MIQRVPYRFEEYCTTVEGAKEMLVEQGVAIIPNLLNDEECTAMDIGAWELIESLTSDFSTPLRHNDVNTWRSFYDLTPSHGMLLQHYGVGHAQHLWDVRQNVKVVDVFSQLWAVPREDLLTSFDGTSIALPHEITNRGHDRGCVWLHLDQSPTRPELECYQGWVTSRDTHVGDATLTFLTDSHRHLCDFRDHFDIKEKADWFRLSPEHIDWYAQQGCEQYAIRCPKGSMVLWDSRLVHAGYQADPFREHANWRNVVYACMLPRNRARPADIAKKQKWLRELRTTSHWPQKPKPFPKTPRSYGNVMPRVTPVCTRPRLTPLGRRLAGLHK